MDRLLEKAMDIHYLLQFLKHWMSMPYSSKPGWLQNKINI
jgi:hypothetical protein